jgi:hypothetical protein
MLRRLFLSLVTILACLASPTSAVSPQQVDAALDRAKSFLYSEQNSGLWEKQPAPPSDTEADKSAHTATGGQWGGTTALAVYALLAAGESPQEPRLAPAIQFLRTVDIKGTYALGLRAQLWPFLPATKQTHQLAAADVTRLQNASLKNKPALGLYDYLLSSKRSYRFDHSISQYGVLGMWACQRSGIEVPIQYWQTTQDAWIRDQQPDGSWAYGKAPKEKYPETASMTAAGVATLFITQDYIHANDGINCTGNVTSPRIDAGLTWLGAHFEQVFTDHGIDSPYYGLYGIQRVGVASGRKYLGAVDWYQRGADFLLSHQTRTGSWGPVPDTCFAMLFLSRGRAPVLFNKLQYNTANNTTDDQVPWNQRPRDIAHLTRWISTQTERDLNWQIVNLDSPAADLLDAPVLFLSGNKPLDFSPQQEAKLREYCQAGGLILGNPDCDNSAFTDSFRRLGRRLFHEYEFRNLPANHPIFTAEQFPRTSWKSAPTLLGLSNGVRELMLLTNNSDPARSWQLEETGRHLSDFQLADDIVLYAIGKKNLVEKGDSFALSPDPAIQATQTLPLARIQYSGNWDPEPGGWRRMTALLHNNFNTDLKISPITLGTQRLSAFKLATLTGTTSIKFSAAQQLELKDFIQQGGTLIIDAAGGSSEFASSIEAQLQILFGPAAGAQLKKPLPPDDPIFNAAGNQLAGNVIKTFTYRPFARSLLGSVRSPLLCAIRITGRPAVYYSRQDLSAGLVGQPTDGIIGYDPQLASEIMTNLLLSSAKATQPKVPAVK